MDQKKYTSGKCHSCKCWALQEISFVDGGANFICSHCQYTLFKKGSKQKINSDIVAFKKIFPAMAAQIPALQNLKNPGDYIAPEQQGSE